MLNEKLKHNSSIETWHSQGKVIQTDSRKVKPGDVFIATKSDGSSFYRSDDDIQEATFHKFNSHVHVSSAIKQGATEIIVSEDVDASEIEKPKTEIIKVKDTVEFLAENFRAVIEKDKKFVVGVTGSTGKSTLNEMVAVVLGKTDTYKHLSDRPTPISIPIRALNKDEFYKAKNVSLEMPMDGLDQITQLCQIAPPDVGVILNINDSHIVQLGSIENIVKAKMEMALGIKDDGIVVINLDDPYLRPEIAKLMSNGKKVLTFGEDEYSDVRISQCKLGNKGMDVEITYGSQKSTIKSVYIGKSISSSLAAAVGVGLAKGEPLSDICERLSSMESLPGRMSVLSGNLGELIIDDTRLATPQSTHRMFESITSLETGNGRKILIQGPILRTYQHGLVKPETISLLNKFDGVVFFGDTTWYTGEKNFTKVLNLDELSYWYQQNILPSDIVIFNSSEGVKMWNIVKNFVKAEQRSEVYNPEIHD